MQKLVSLEIEKKKKLLNQLIMERKKVEIIGRIE